MTLLAWAAEGAVQAEAWPWLTPVIAIGTLLLGGGGVAALIKARSDSRQGVAQQETAEDDALSNRWKAIIEVQTKSLLEPLQTRLHEVEGTVARLEKDLQESRRKYWSAISHIRTLYTWIARHMPDDIEHTQIPNPPAVLAEDV